MDSETSERIAEIVGLDDIDSVHDRSDVKSKLSGIDGGGTPKQVDAVYFDVVKPQNDSIKEDKKTKRTRKKSKLLDSVTTTANTIYQKRRDATGDVYYINLKTSERVSEQSWAAAHRHEK